MSERLQGTFRDRDKTLRGLEGRATGQAYVDGLVLHYNYFRPHESLEGKKPAEAAGAELPFEDWGGCSGDKRGQGMIDLPTLPLGGYATIVVDPPWPVHNGKGYKTKPGVYGNYPIESRYPLMPLPEIKSLPVLELAAERCFVFIWTTQRFLPAALECLTEWGFQYRFTMVWHKPAGPQPFGYPCFNAEFVVVGNRGNRIG